MLEDLKQAAQSFPSVRMVEAEPRGVLQALAQGYAEWMADRCRQGGHRGFTARFDEVRQRTGLIAREISAEAWARQHDDGPVALWREMLGTWRRSRGHWSICQQPHKLIGAAMAQGRNGVWYACVLVAD